jgi:hypothetical protein
MPGHSLFRMGLFHLDFAALTDVRGTDAPCTNAANVPEGRDVERIGQDLAEVDVAATAVFVMGLRGIDWAAARGLEVMVIDHEDQVHMTPGFASHCD